MPELLLLRHAKSSWDDPTLADFDRPLAQRGRRAAHAMGKEILRRGWVPDLAIVSPALRTRQTWQLVADALPALDTRFDATIYEAGPQAILAAIRNADNDCRRLIVVGHNPGMEDLAAMLANAGTDAAAVDRLRTKFPTAALARFAFDGIWSDLAAGGATLTHFLRPRDLK
ncbi:histidine phosphatase family protein [Nitratireductor mangrovi]|uniref:Histidine phosphatase family protein n=1 Tax=Nitratireductor mangrovi TaxID=2599600 RepID=A0A5B8L317_9HYPH|nr:histidine phosphatase family protein [Nitratireductor mangrovi]QDZ02020.1 histidine phosphatase family protein [Nitratireductor mangrovi]